MSNFPLHDFVYATWQTIYMVVLSGFLSIAFGTAIGVWLFVTKPGQIMANRPVNQVLGFIVNVTRSIPYIILMIAIIPFTRWLVGTSIGSNAAVVSLTLAAIPFFARIAEAAFDKVPVGLIEAARSMGASHRQIVLKVLIPEGLTGLVSGATLTLISLIGYSAMAGAVGGGGLGELAINYGYQRFNPEVMLITVVLLIVIVQIVQYLGDWLAKRPPLKPMVISFVVLFVICIIAQAWPTGSAQQQQELKVGIMAGVQQKIMQVAKSEAWQRYHLKLKLVPFADYVLPNTALNDGDINANIFQHVPYLDAQIKARGYKLTPIAKTFAYPMGFYSTKISKLNQLPNGASIAIPSDPSNEGRALRLLQKAGLIRLRPGVGINGTVMDITANPKHLKIDTLAAAQIPHALPDVYLAAITNDFVKEAHLNVSEALIKEGADSPYANVIVVRTKDKNNPVFKKLIAVMHSKPVVKAVLKAFPDGAAIPAWH